MRGGEMLGSRDSWESFWYFLEVMLVVLLAALPGAKESQFR